MKSRRIVIAIDEITLGALDARARREIGATLERELRRAFSTGIASRGGELARISAPPIALAPAPASPGLAAGLADRIHRAVTAAGAPRKGRL
jgi:hypothetical protein